MSEETREPNHRAPLTEEQIRAHTIGELQPLPGSVQIVDYDPRWPELFQRETGRIRAALGRRALQIEHVGSTSVPGLVAKPIIDILLAVTDSADEGQYAPALEGVGYILRIREPDWHEHRMFKGSDPDTNLHVFSLGCREIECVMAFRDWLRTDAADRELYASHKLALGREGMELCPELRRCQDGGHRGNHWASLPGSRVNPHPATQAKP